MNAYPVKLGHCPKIEEAALPDDRMCAMHEEEVIALAAFTKIKPVLASMAVLRLVFYSLWQSSSIP
ncbi:MAG TPA: hypothetical protein DEG55_03980 [Acidaminococcaceae bacterium]|nr:hypothetical protein [Acidaminococcaceae bacterium]